jgi:hypothetical protein
MTTDRQGAVRPGGLRPAAAAIVLFASILWSTTVMIVWIALVSFTGESVAVAVMGLGFVVFWGPVLGLVAGGSHILVSFLLGRALPRLPRDIVSALLGWCVPLGAWLALGSGGLEPRTVAGSVAAAGMGSIVNFIIVRGRLGHV